MYTNGKIINKLQLSDPNVLLMSAQIFGKVTGNTIFNVLRMGDVEVDERDRPIDPIKILSVEVLWNPFDDIVPRDLSKVADSGKVESTKLEKVEKVAKAVKDKRLLSFGSEEEETEDISIAGL